MADEFCLKMPDFHVTFRDILHTVNLRHGTDGFTSAPKEVVLKIFFALKNPTASVGFEPANLGTKGQHATSRPPKPRVSCSVYHLRDPVHTDLSVASHCYLLRVTHTEARRTSRQEQTHRPVDQCQFVPETAWQRQVTGRAPGSSGSIIVYVTSVTALLWELKCM